MDKKCYKFESCSAPFCPLDEDYAKDAIWYSDEEICTNRKFSNKIYIRQQKKLKKKQADSDTYYTFEMLDFLYAVRKGAVGLDPDLPEGAQMKAWKKRHPGRKSLTETQKEHLREMLGKRLKTGIGTQEFK